MGVARGWGRTVDGGPGQGVATAGMGVRLLSVKVWSGILFVSASRSPPGFCSDNVVAVPSLYGASARIHFYEFAMVFGILFGDLGWLGTLFGYPGTILGTLWAHILRSRMGRVAQGAPRGTTTKIESPIWEPFWSQK